MQGQQKEVNSIWIRGLAQITLLSSQVTPLLVCLSAQMQSMRQSATTTVPQLSDFVFSSPFSRVVKLNLRLARYDQNTLKDFRGFAAHRILAAEPYFLQARSLTVRLIMKN